MFQNGQGYLWKDKGVEKHALYVKLINNKLKPLKIAFWQILHKVLKHLNQKVIGNTVVINIP